MQWVILKLKSKDFSNLNKCLEGLENRNDTKYHFERKQIKRNRKHYISLIKTVSYPGEIRKRSVGQKKKYLMTLRRHD